MEPKDPFVELWGKSTERNGRIRELLPIAHQSNAQIYTEASVWGTNMVASSESRFIPYCD